MIQIALIIVTIFILIYKFITSCVKNNAKNNQQIGNTNASNNYANNQNFIGRLMSNIKGNRNNEIDKQSLEKYGGNIDEIEDIMTIFIIRILIVEINYRFLDVYDNQQLQDYEPKIQDSINKIIKEFVNKNNKNNNDDNNDIESKTEEKKEIIKTKNNAFDEILIYYQLIKKYLLKDRPINETYKNLYDFNDNYFNDNIIDNYFKYNIPNIYNKKPNVPQLAYYLRLVLNGISEHNRSIKYILDFKNILDLHEKTKYKISDFMLNNRGIKNSDKSETIYNMINPLVSDDEDENNMIINLEEYDVKEFDKNEGISDKNEGISKKKKYIKWDESYFYLSIIYEYLKNLKMYMTINETKLTLFDKRFFMENINKIDEYMKYNLYNVPNSYTKRQFNFTIFNKNECNSIYDIFKYIVKDNKIYIYKNEENKNEENKNEENKNEEENKNINQIKYIEFNDERNQSFLSSVNLTDKNFKLFTGKIEELLNNYREDILTANNREDILIDNNREDILIANDSIKYKNDIDSYYIYKIVDLLLFEYLNIYHNIFKKEMIHCIDLFTQYYYIYNNTFNNFYTNIHNIFENVNDKINQDRECKKLKYDSKITLARTEGINFQIYYTQYIPKFVNAIHNKNTTFLDIDETNSLETIYSDIIDTNKTDNIKIIKIIEKFIDDESKIIHTHITYKFNGNYIKKSGETEYIYDIFKKIMLDEKLQHAIIFYSHDIHCVIYYIRKINNVYYIYLFDPNSPDEEDLNIIISMFCNQNKDITIFISNTKYYNKDIDIKLQRLFQVDTGYCLVTCYFYAYVLLSLINNYNYYFPANINISRYIRNFMHETNVSILDFYKKDEEYYKNSENNEKNKIMLTEDDYKNNNSIKFKLLTIELYNKDNRMQKKYNLTNYLNFLTELVANHKKNKYIFENLIDNANIFYNYIKNDYKYDNMKFQIFKLSKEIGGLNSLTFMIKFVKVFIINKFQPKINYYSHLKLFNKKNKLNQMQNDYFWNIKHIEKIMESYTNNIDKYTFNNKDIYLRNILYINRIGTIIPKNYLKDKYQIEKTKSNDINLSILYKCIETSDKTNIIFITENEHKSVITNYDQNEEKSDIINYDKTEINNRIKKHQIYLYQFINNSQQILHKFYSCNVVQQLLFINREAEQYLEYENRNLYNGFKYINNYKFLNTLSSLSNLYNNNIQIYSFLTDIKENLIDKWNKKYDSIREDEPYINYDQLESILTNCYNEVSNEIYMVKKYEDAIFTIIQYKLVQSHENGTIKFLELLFKSIIICLIIESIPGFKKPTN